MVNVLHQRTIPMQVLSLGMCRTGTESMRRALTKLDYGFVYHANATIERPHHYPMWAELTERKFGPSKTPIQREDFDRILGDCGAVTDCPGVAYWEELMDAYPESKIVLVERDVEAWFRSFKAAVLDEVFSWRTSVLLWATKWGLVDATPFQLNETIMSATFHASSWAEMEKNARSVYNDHYRRVAARAEADGRPLLSMNLGDGWEPLCRFLGKSVPIEPFPRGNAQVTTTQMVRNAQNRLLYQLGRVVMKRLLIFVAVLAVAVALRDIGQSKK